MNVPTASSIVTATSAHRRRRRRRHHRHITLTTTTITTMRFLRRGDHNHFLDRIVSINWLTITMPHRRRRRRRGHWCRSSIVEAAEAGEGSWLILLGLRAMGMDREARTMDLGMADISRDSLGRESLEVGVEDLEGSTVGLGELSKSEIDVMSG
ncbi:unnamed protein product [Discula destructiva]